MKRSLFTAVTLLCLLTACTSAAPKRALPASSAAPEPAEVQSIQILIYESPYLDAVLDTLIAGFQQRHPEYRVEKRVLAEGMAVDAALAEFHKEMEGLVPGK